MALLNLEREKVGELDCYSTTGRHYPNEYTGLGRCHICALYNMCEDPAKEAFDTHIRHTQTKKVNELLEKYS